MTGNQEPQVRVGLSLLVVRDDHVLLGRRKSSHGAGQYGTPGGHMEHGEDFVPGILREVKEECGPDFFITEPQHLCVSNVLEYPPKHYVDIAMVSHWISGEPTNMEPHKLEGWEWHPIDHLPSGLFAVVENMVTAYQTERRVF